MWFKFMFQSFHRSDEFSSSRTKIRQTSGLDLVGSNPHETFLGLEKVLPGDFLTFGVRVVSSGLKTIQTFRGLGRTLETLGGKTRGPSITCSEPRFQTSQRRISAIHASSLWFGKDLGRVTVYVGSTPPPTHQDAIG